MTSLHVPVLIAAFLLSSASELVGGSGKFGGLYFESAGRGQPVVLIHGGQLDRRMWDEQFSLVARKCLAIRYDIRGFGKSDSPATPYSNAGDLHSLLSHLRVKKTGLVGLSLGAAVAMDFALLYPDEVDSLVLVCPGLGGFPFQDKANDLRAVVEAARDGFSRKAADLWLQNPYMSVAMENPELRQRLRKLAEANGRCWLNNPLLIRPLTPPAAQRLKEISAPVLVIGGDRDVSDIQKIVSKLAATIPGAQRKILSGAGHLVPMEKPSEFNRILLEFLARPEGKLSAPGTE